MDADGCLLAALGMIRFERPLPDCLHQLSFGKISHR